MFIYSLTLIWLNLKLIFFFFFFFFPAFLMYAALVIASAFILIFHFIPQYGQTHIMVYIGICSLVGSLSVCINI
jgi:hypothetical protein